MGRDQGFRGETAAGRPVRRSAHPARAVVLLGLMSALAPAAALAQDQTAEPRLPTAAPRAPVTQDPPDPKAKAPAKARPARPAPAAAVAPAPTVEAAPAAAADPSPAEGDLPAEATPPPVPAPAATPARSDRSQIRATLLRRLQNGDVVVLDADPLNPPTVTEPINVAEAVAFALQNNFEVKSAAEKTRGTHWEFYGAVGQFVPKLEYEKQSGRQRSSPASYHASGDTLTARNNALVNASHHNMWTRTYSARQPVIDVGIITDILNRSDLHDAATADETAVRERVALDTITCFYRLVRSRLTIAFASSYKSNLEKLAGRMRERVSGGGASGVELDRISARATTAQAAMIEAGAEYQAALIEFRRLTNVTPVKLQLPVRLLPEMPDQIDEVLTHALRTNPEYQAALTRADAASVATWKQFSNLLPKMAIQFTDTRTYNAGGVTQELPNNVAPSDVYEFSNDRKLMMVFSWSLNLGVDVPQGMANAAFARQASYQATDSRLRLEESVRTSFSALNAANGLIDSTASALESNAKVATAFEEQFLNGSRQLLDLLDAFERLYQSQNELSRLLISETSAAYLIRRQMGELIDALVIPAPAEE